MQCVEGGESVGMSEEGWGVWGVCEKVRRVCNVWREGRVRGE